MSPSDDDGHAISYKVLPRGTPVRSADYIKVGTVRRVQDNVRENIFDGIVIETRAGPRFVDAPEVAHIAERAVTTTFTAAEADQHLVEMGSAVAKRAKNTTTARRAKRWGRSLRQKWDRR